MPHQRIKNLAGFGHSIHSPIDHNPLGECHLPGMSERETRQFLREEQSEGYHPSLKGKRF